MNDILMFIDDLFFKFEEYYCNLNIFIREMLNTTITPQPVNDRIVQESTTISYLPITRAYKPIRRQFLRWDKWILFFAESIEHIIPQTWASLTISKDMINHRNELSSGICISVSWLSYRIYWCEQFKFKYKYAKFIFIW